MCLSGGKGMARVVHPIISILLSDASPNSCFNIAHSIERSPLTSRVKWIQPGVKYPKGLKRVVRVCFVTLALVRAVEQQPRLPLSREDEYGFHCSTCQRPSWRASKELGSSTAAHNRTFSHWVQKIGLSGVELLQMSTMPTVLLSVTEMEKGHAVFWPCVFIGSVLCQRQWMGRPLAMQPHDSPVKWITVVG